MKYQPFLAVFVSSCASLCSSLGCKRNVMGNCPEDCQWSEIHSTCIDCDVGFYGINCSSQCRYPNYGENCQQDCSHCKQEVCNASYGCLANDVTTYTDKEESNLDSDLHMVIGISVGLGVVMVIAAFFVITITNRRFYTRHLRENAHYVGSVVTEQTISSEQRPPKQYTDLCNANDTTDGGIYTLARTLRYENVEV